MDETMTAEDVDLSTVDWKATAEELQREVDRLQQRERDLMRERDAIEFERDELLDAKRGIR